MNPSQIEIVNIYVKKPDFYCGRNSPLGNPFRMNQPSDRNTVCEQYKEYFRQKVEVERNQSMLRQLTAIKKKLLTDGHVILGCFCAPQRCHCETIKEYVLKSIEIEANI